MSKVQMPSGSCKTLASSIGPTSIQVPWCPLRLEGPQSENPRIISISQRKSEKVTGLPRFAKHHLQPSSKAFAVVEKAAKYLRADRFLQATVYANMLQTCSYVNTVDLMWLRNVLPQQGAALIFTSLSVQFVQ